MRPVAELNGDVWGTFSLLIVALSLLLPSALAAGQASADAGTKPQMRRRYQSLSIENRVQQLAKTLDLSETQQSQVKRILERQQEELRRLRSDPDLPGADRVDKFRSLQEGAIAQIRAVLNEDQKKNYNPQVQRGTQQSRESSREDWFNKVLKPH